jgi:SAM-dependent methyltransferase
MRLPAGGKSAILRVMIESPVDDRQQKLGHSFYSALALRGYDAYVLGFNNRFVWRCPTPRLLGLFQEGVTDNHLDVGVGTGYFLDKIVFPSAPPRIGLFDRNPNSLAHSAERLSRYRPETYCGDILRPISEQPVSAPSRPFDSVSMNYLLHCLPGSVKGRATAIDNAHAMLNPGGLFFGATILGRAIPRNPLARLTLSVANRSGAFGNHQDTVDELRDLLNSRFQEVEIELIGSAAIFRARKSA